MGVTCKPIGANKSIMAKLENELKAKEEAKKVITRPSQKVAALLIALGPSTASEILKNIKDEDLLEQITLDIANWGKVSDEDLNDVLNEFKNAGLNANLYLYDPKKNELQGQKVSVVDDLGRAKFDLDHCSDYTIIITPDRLLSPAELSYGVTTTDTLTTEDIFDGTKIRLVDLFGISGKGRIWLFVIAAVSAALCAAILYMPGFQRNER